MTAQEHLGDPVRPDAQYIDNLLGVTSENTFNRSHNIVQQQSCYIPCILHLGFRVTSVICHNFTFTCSVLLLLPRVSSANRGNNYDCICPSVCLSVCHLSHSGIISTKQTYDDAVFT